MTMQEIYHQAFSFYASFSSTTQLRYPVLVDLKRNIHKFCEATVILHVNPAITQKDLSEGVGFIFKDEHMEILADYHLRDILQDRYKSFNKDNDTYSILSARQLYRRCRREASSLQ